MSTCYMYIIIKEGNFLYAHNHQFLFLVFADTSDKLPLCDSLPPLPIIVYTEFWVEQPSLN